MSEICSTFAAVFGSPMWICPANRNASEAIFRFKSGGPEDLNESMIQS